MTSAPSAIAPMIALSMAPNTRPMTSSGTTRCRIVYALTSTTELRDPDQEHARGSGGERRRDDDEEQRRRPEDHPDAEVDRQAATLGEHQRQEAADKGADSHDRVEVSDPSFAEIQQVERDRHEEHERRPGDDRLGAVEADQQAERAVAEDRPEAYRHLRKKPSLGLSSRLPPPARRP